MLAPTGTPSASATSSRKPASTGSLERPSRRGAAARCASAPDATDPPSAACQPLAGQHEEPEQHEHERERTGRRHVEGDIELGEDLGREGLVAEDLKRAVLGQDDERDEQTSAEDRPSGLAEGDPPERLQAPGAEAARDLLLAWVGAAEARGDRQIHERIDREGHHEHGAAEALHPCAERRPAEADDEVRDRERHDHQHRPDPPARQVGALDEPRRGGADHRAQHSHDDGQADGVPQQPRGQRAEDQVHDRRAPAPCASIEQEHQRRGQHDRDRHAQRQQSPRPRCRPRRHTTPRPQPRRLACGPAGTGVPSSERPAEGLRTHSSPALRSSAIAVDPSPSCGIVIAFGCSSVERGLWRGGA